MKKYIIFFALVLFGLTLSAQSNRAIRKADSWFEKREFRQAAIEYEALINSANRNRRASNETKKYLYSRLGETYLNLREYIKAEYNFEHALRLGADDPLFLRNHARARQANRDVSNDPGAELNPVTIETKLNAANNQYALAWYRGSLLFSCDKITQNRNRNDGVAPLMFFTSRPVFDFSSGKINDWTTPERFDRIEADPLYFVHSFAFDENTETYYVMRCLIKTGAMDDRCNIFAYRETNGRMSQPMRQSFHSREANIGHPTLSSDGNVMIFSSTKDGNSSLFIVQKISANTWTEPLLIGSVINTNNNETYPKLFRDSLLFFSSDGHPGMGGLDIFYTTISVNGRAHALSKQTDLSQVEFSTPVNMGAPINSGADDVSFLLRNDKIGGFFISNRAFAGQNRNIIFSFENIPSVLDPDGAHMLAYRQRGTAGIEFAMPFGDDTDKSRLNRRVAELNAKVFDHNAEVARLNEALAQNSAEKLRSGADIPRLRAIQDSINNEKARIAGDIAELNGDIEQLNSEIRGADNQNPNRHNDPRWILDDQITQQNAIITRQNAEITRQNAKIASLSNDLAIVTDNLLVLDEEISILEVELDKLNEKSPVGAAERERLDTERERLDGAIAKLRQERAGHRDQLADLLAGRSALEQEYVGQSRELIDANNEIARLSNELRHLSGGTDDIIAALNDEIARLRAANRDCNEEIARLRAELEAKPKEVYVEVPIETFVERAVPGEILI